MASYAQTTLGQLTAQISALLQDPNNVYWTAEEILFAVAEALLYWGALTSYWRERGTFNTAAATPFYDLSVELPTLRSRNYNVDDICREVQYALFEQSSGVSGSGLTTQFTIDQITTAVIAAANQFDIDGTLPLTFGEFPANNPPPDGRIALDQSVIGLSRVAWKDVSTGVYVPLRREDEFSAQSIAPAWNLNPAMPNAYAYADTPPITIQLLPPPTNSGTLHLLYNASKALDTAIGPTSQLDIPDEYALAVKWYALYILLNSYNEGYDPYRAKYCYERYQQILSTAEQMRALNRVQINGQLIALDTIWNMDAALPWWQNMTGAPKYAACAWDVLCLAPLAPDSSYSVLCDVVRAAPVPLVASDFIQLGREELPYIIDYARHILSFKLGGAEFGSTFPLYDNFLAGAKQRNQMLSTRVRYLTPLFDQARLNEDLLQTA